MLNIVKSQTYIGFDFEAKCITRIINHILYIVIFTIILHFEHY